MGKVRITAVRKTEYTELMAQYENPILDACNIKVGQVFVAVDGRKPENLCPSAWDSMADFVQKLDRGGGDFFDGWMKNPRSAMISCNDGFRPVSFYLEALDDEK